MDATSDDGRVIGGAHSFGPNSEAVLWLDREAVYLRTISGTAAWPHAFSGWINTGFITAVSPDGRVIVGPGGGAERPPGLRRHARLPAAPRSTK